MKKALQSIYALMFRQMCFFALMVLLLSGCKDSPPKEQLIDITKQQLAAFAYASSNMALDCGEDVIVEKVLPFAFSHNPGWLGWRGPYTDGEAYSKDCWGMPYKFQRIGPKLRAISAGPDRKYGSDDDLIVEVTLPERRILEH